MALPNKIIIGSDHAGYELKEACKEHLKELGIEVADMGTHSTESVDYPDFVHPVAEGLESGDYPVGLVVCGSGQGVAITANKHQGVRCALCWNTDVAKLARKHNDANVLALAARFTARHYALDILETFLRTTFEGGRHARRVEKISCS